MTGPARAASTGSGPPGPVRPADLRSPSPGRPGGASRSGGGGGRIRTAIATLGRVTAGPLLVRAVVFGAGFAVLVLAVPSPMWAGRLVFGAVLLAAMPAIYPASAWVSAVEFGAVVLWFGTTTVTRYEIPPGHLLGLAVAIYLHHSWSVRAAVLPVDTAVPLRLLGDWVLRTAGVLAVALPLGLLVVALPELWGRSEQVYLPVLGIVALLAAGYGLVHLARR